MEELKAEVEFLFQVILAQKHPSWKSDAQELVLHLEECEEEFCCFTNCLKAKNSINHFRECQEEDCLICTPSRMINSDASPSEIQSEFQGMKFHARHLQQKKKSKKSPPDLLEHLASYEFHRKRFFGLIFPPPSLTNKCQ